MNYNYNNIGFSLSLSNGYNLINYTDNNPFLYIGYGREKIDSYRGNYFIEDYLIVRKPLYISKIKETVNGIKLFLTDKINNDDNLYSMEVMEGIDNNIVIRIKIEEKNINRIFFRINSNKEEKLYGLGEQFSYFNLKGKNFPIWTSEQGVGRNKSTYITFLADTNDRAGGDYWWTFFPQPSYVSNHKYFLISFNSAYMDFNFKDDDFTEIQVWDNELTITIGEGDNYENILEKMTKILGRQPVLPDWVYNGVILGIQGGTETCLRLMEKAINKGVKVSGIWAQDWEGIRITSFGKRLFWNWQWNKEIYPDLDKEIKKLEKRGIKFLGYVNPYLASDGPLYKIASEKGYIAKNEKGEDYLVDFGEFYAGVVDLTNPEVYNWYKELIKKELIGLGLAGWMADFGEYLPTDVQTYSKRSGMLLHNEWPVLWAKLNREVVEETNNLGNILFFMRAGFTGIQRYSLLMWAGDQNVDFSLDDGLASVIVATLSMGMSGFGLNHSDIGGYTTLYGMKRTKELFMRWAEMAAFTPVMRTHEGNRPYDNWQFHSDDETLIHLAKMTKIYTTISPYIKEAVKENSERGIPVQRPLFLYYDEEECYNIKYQYLLGRDLLVAPVYEEKKTKWKVYLPDDEWINIWDTKIYNKGYIDIDAPIGYPPVFYRNSSKWKNIFEKIKNL